MNKLQCVALVLSTMCYNFSKMWRRFDSSNIETPIGSRRASIRTLRKKMNTSKYRPGQKQ